MDCKDIPAPPGLTLTVAPKSGDGKSVSFDVCLAHQEWTLERIIAALKTESQAKNAVRYECSACKSEVSSVKQFFVGSAGHDICLPCFSGQPLVKLLRQLPSEP
jgi:hypothetical protein